MRQSDYKYEGFPSIEQVVEQFNKIQEFPKCKFCRNEMQYESESGCCRECEAKLPRPHTNYLSVTEFAKAISRSECLVRILVRDKKINAIQTYSSRIGAIPKEELEKYLKGKNL